MMPSEARLMAAMEATWPPAATRRLGPWLLREGQGGGKRVSATSAQGAWRPADLDAAEQAMGAMGQAELFQMGPDDAALDAALEARGYRIVDPVTLYAAPVEALLAEPLPAHLHYTVWEPLAIQRQMWATGGIGPARLAVMDRAAGPKTTLLTRKGMAPGATGFVALHDGIGMVHALEVLPAMRRKGQGAMAMRAAARWTRDMGGSHVGLAVTRGNTGGNALYHALGMTPCGGYHYRVRGGKT